MASSDKLPLSFLGFITFLGPLVGIALGFDAVNSERANGTLSRVLSQPVYRDAFINGKFLAGLATISIMLISIVLLVSGMGLRLIGIPPTLDEALRLVSFVVLCIVYVAFWMSIAVLFSILFRQTATSALAAIAAWLFLAVFWPIIAGSLGAIINPVDPRADPVAQLLASINQFEVAQTLSRFSPNTLFSEAVAAILSPEAIETRSLGLVFESDVVGMLPTPLPLLQSLLVVWPHVTGLIALTMSIFAIAYVKFMREEIRSG